MSPELNHKFNDKLTPMMYDKDTDKKIKPTTNEHTLFVSFVCGDPYGSRTHDFTVKG